MDDEKVPSVNSAGVKCFLAFWSLTQTELVFHAHLTVRSSEAAAATEFLLVPSTWLHHS